MHNRPHNLILVLVTLLIILPVRAQEHPQFQHFDTRGSFVKSLTLDRDGVLWMGSSLGLFSAPQMQSPGATTYDRHHAPLRTSIRETCCDSLGNIWLTNQDNDIMRYHPRTGEFELLESATFLDEGAQFHREYHLLTNLSGTGWIWRNGLLHQFTTGQRQSRQLLSLPDEVIRQVQHPEPNLLLVLTDTHLYFLALPRGTVQRVIDVPESAQTMCMTPDRHIWFSHFHRLFGYDYQRQQFIAAITMPSQVISLCTDWDGRLWAGTVGDGIYILSPQGDVIQTLRHNPWDANSLLSDRISMLHYNAARQTLWVSYNKGGISVCTHQQSDQLIHKIALASQQDCETDVLTLAESPDGSAMWVGLEDRGVFRRATNSDTWTNVLPEGSVTALYAESDGTLWTGLYGRGLVRRDAHGSLTHYLSGDSPFALVRYGHLLYVALLGRGVWTLDTRTGQLTDTHIGPLYAFDLQFHGNSLYAATTEGLFVRQGQSPWRQLDSKGCRSLRFDHHGYFWILGCEGYEGLNVLSPDGTPITVPATLKYAPLRSIAIDHDDNVWLMHDGVLQRLCHQPGQPGTLQHHTYVIHSSSNPTYYNFNASLISSDGYLWIGSSQGFQRISTESLLYPAPTTSICVPLVVSAITINDRSFSPGDSLSGHTLFQSDVIYTSQLRLSHRDNNLIIHVAHPDGNISDNITYYYQLQGATDTWLPIQSGLISLSNLSPGRYTLLVRSSDGQPTTLLSIRIAPPLWNTWWAYLLYALIFALVIAAIVRSYLHRQHYRQQMHQLQLQQKQEAHINEMKLRFFTNISHDLRTPLSLIISPVEELLHTATDAKQHTTLQLIQRNAQLLLSLVNQILDFRRLEFGRERLALSYGDIIAALRGVCQSFTIKAQHEQMEYTFSTSAEHIDTFFDSDKTSKVLMNLLSNAFKFTPAHGSINVDIQLQDQQIEIRITDSGPGIPDDDKAHIFDRFYQSSHTNTTTMGSGIGLHIAREYARLQGGDITVTDAPHHPGTQFVVTIPLRKQTDEAITPPPATADTQEAEAETLVNTDGETHLLLVDDNADLLQYMSQSLSDHYHITCASNGAQAWEILQQQDIDILVSDVMMAPMDGLELCRQVKTTLATSHISVVLLTAKSMSTDELAGLEAGADDYITKPFRMEILRQRIANLVERSSHLHQRFISEDDINPSDIAITSIDQQLISQAIAIVESHIGEADFGVEQLSEELAMHRSHLYKKLQHITGQTPNQFIRLLRLKRGRQLLEQGGMYVSEAAYQVGFNSPRLFSKYFKESFGVIPRDMRGNNE